MNYQIELTNRCNLDCRECPHRYMKREQQSMSLETVQAIVDNLIGNHEVEKLIGKPSTIILHKDGEPLLHPNLLAAMDILSKARPDAKFDIYTNGLLLTPGHLSAFAQFPNQVDLLISFHYYQEGGQRVDKYAAVEKMLREWIPKAPDSLNFILVTHETDISDLQFLKEWLQRWQEFAKHHKQLRAVHLNSNINPWGGLIDQPQCSVFPSCPYLDGQHLFIGVEGDVLACCIDLEEEIQFGNVNDIVAFDHTVSILWDRREFYQDPQKGAQHELCKRCLTGVL